MIGTDTMGDPIYDAMALAIEGVKWKGSTDRHIFKLQHAWFRAWGVVDTTALGASSMNWEALMREQHAAEIAQYKALSMRKLRAVLKLMDYEAGLPFYCAVMALASKLEEKQRAKSKS